MPAVCRFYLKGNCRYGRNCKFEHPGENSTNSSSRAGGFSFTKALEEVVTGPAEGFSFTKALQETVINSHPFDQQYINPDTSYFRQNQSTHFNNQSDNYFTSNDTYHYNQPQHNQQQFDNSFSFTQALQTTGLDQGPSLFRPASTLFDVDDIDMRGGELTALDSEPQLTELELKAYQSDKFIFRLIPIRPPPKHLCF